MTSGCDCRTYSAPSGLSYEFYMGRFTEVKDSADALHFLNAANGTAFEVEKGPVKKAIDALKKLIKEKVVDEEKAPDESGILDTDPDAPIDAIDPSEPTADETVAEIPEGDQNDNPKKDDEEKAKCPICGGMNVHYQDGCLDCKEAESKKVVDDEKKEVLFTHEGLKALNGKQQSFLIKSTTTTAIPRLESGKIELLLKLQTEGANLVELLKGYVN